MIPRGRKKSRLDGGSLTKFRQRGFTAIEVMVVAVIVGILLMIITVAFTSAGENDTFYLNTDNGKVECAGTRSRPTCDWDHPR